MKKEEKENERRLNKKSIFALIAFILVLVFVVILIIFLLRGQTTVSGEYPEDVKDRSLVCRVEYLSYPIFTYDGSDKKDLEVSIIFGQSSARSISLKYNLYYSDAEKIKASEAINHAAMNKSFGADSLHADALGISYARLSDRMSTSLYSQFGKVDSVSAKYFMIDRYEDYSIPSSLEELKANYERKGFSCQVSE